MVAMNEKRLKGLQQDANRQQQQALAVAAQQQQAQQQAVALSNDLRNTSAQLEAVKARIRELEAEQANPEVVLPPPPPPSAAGQPSASNPSN
jgi:DNA repair ATPase RecN